MTTSVTLQLTPEEYERLKALADQRGLQPSDLAHQFVHDRLEPEDDAGKRRERGLKALEQFEQLRAGIRAAGNPSVDAVELVRKGREELERRSIF